MYFRDIDIVFTTYFKGKFLEKLFVGLLKEKGTFTNIGSYIGNETIKMK